MQLAQGNMERPLVRSDFSQAVEGQVDAFADTETGGADKQECIRSQVIGAPQLFLQELIFVEGKRPGQITTPGRQILATNEIRPQGVPVDS